MQLQSSSAVALLGARRTDQEHSDDAEHLSQAPFCDFASCCSDAVLGLAREVELRQVLQQVDKFLEATRRQEGWQPLLSSLDLLA